MNRMLRLGASFVSARAMASPGYKWPPVPPPATTMVACPTLSGGAAADGVESVTGLDREASATADGSAGDRVWIGRVRPHHALADAPDVDQDAGHEQGENEVRSPIRDERQGQPGRWEQTDDDADVEIGRDESRHSQPDREQLL